MNLKPQPYHYKSKMAGVTHFEDKYSKSSLGDGKLFSVKFQTVNTFKLCRPYTQIYHYAREKV